MATKWQRGKDILLKSLFCDSGWVVQKIRYAGSAPDGSGRLPGRDLEEERIDRHCYMRHVINIQQDAICKVGVSLIDDVVRKVCLVRRVVGGEGAVERRVDCHNVNVVAEVRKER